jgi:hypothetical protein
MTGAVMTGWPPEFGGLATIPFQRWLKLAGISHNSGYALLHAGEVDSITAGFSRLIVIASWAAYIERQRSGHERDPVERAAAISAFKKSLAGRGGHQAARARERKRPVASAARREHPVVLARPSS